MEIVLRDTLCNELKLMVRGGNRKAKCDFIEFGLNFIIYVCSMEISVLTRTLRFILDGNNFVGLKRGLKELCTLDSLV